MNNSKMNIIKNLIRMLSVIVVLGIFVQVNMTDTKAAYKYIKMSKESTTLAVGSKLKLKVSNKPSSTAAVTWRTTNKYAVKVTKSGKITALKSGSATIKAKCNGQVAVCRVTVPDTERRVVISAANLTLTDGYTYQMKAWSALPVQYISSNTSVATVTEKGLVQANNPGVAVITAKSTKGFAKCVVTVRSNGITKLKSNKKTKSTKIKLSTKNIIVYGPSAGSNRQQYVSISGVSASSKIKWTNSKKSYATITSYKDKVAIFGLKAGSGKVTAKVNGKKYKVKYTVVCPKFGKIKSVLAKKKKTTIKITGITDATGKALVTPVFTSRDTTVATVTDQGVIKGKKAGVTYVDVTLGSLSYSYRVEVAAKGVKTIVKNTQQICDLWKYSQAKRMSVGYYDCSALVWKGYRSYKNYNAKLGSTNYAPTAGGLFDYLYSKNQIVYLGYTGIDDMQPGDLIFYGDYDNACLYSTPGRTLDIYHVAMYAGNGKVVEKGGQTINYNGTQFIVGIGRLAL